MVTKKISFLSLKNQHGGMLVELMLSIAVAAIIIPFVFRYQQTAVTRAKNIAVTKQMENVQNALERYILENKNVLMKPMGKKITRVKLDDLVYYGLSENIAETYKNDFQLRVLKSADKNNKSTLQGIVILSDKKISPLRTREIVNMGGGKYGFIEGKTTYGGFGAFHASTSEMGTDENMGIVVDNTNQYIWKRGKASYVNSLSGLSVGADDTSESSIAQAISAILVREGESVDVHSLLNQGEKPISILQAALKDATVLDLTGCNMQEVLYYIAQGNPVYAINSSGEAVLLIGYDSSNVYIYNPVSGNTSSVAQSDASADFVAAGNIFISYVD